MPVSEDVNTLSQWVIVATDQRPVFPKGCFGDEQLASSQAVGEAEDEDLRHLVWEEEEFASQYEGERNVWEMWVDSDGNPVRGLVTVYRVPEESSASGAGGPPDGVRTPEAAYTIEETYSGFGEPNTITAPITPPTPTPPTPTSAVPTWTPGADQYSHGGVIAFRQIMDNGQPDGRHAPPPSPGIREGRVTTSQFALKSNSLISSKVFMHRTLKSFETSGRWRLARSLLGFECSVVTTTRSDGLTSA